MASVEDCRAEGNDYTGYRHGSGDSRACYGTGNSGSSRTRNA